MFLVLGLLVMIGVVCVMFSDEKPDNAEIQVLLDQPLGSDDETNLQILEKMETIERAVSKGYGVMSKTRIEVENQLEQTKNFLLQEILKIDSGKIPDYKGTLAGIGKATHAITNQVSIAVEELTPDDIIRAVQFVKSQA